MGMKVLILFALIVVFGSTSPSFPSSDFDFSMPKCKNMTGEERKMCRSDFVLEAQLRLQAASIQARASSEENRLRSDENRFRSEENRFRSEENRLRLKDEAAARSLKFPGLTVDPQDKKSLMVALITLASLTAVVILKAAGIGSNQGASSVPSYRSCSRLRTA